MDPRFALLQLCFFLSGFSALIYQTAWSRELSFVFGTSKLAVAAVLAAYMGGLALGAAVAARWAHRVRRPVLVYGVLELAIAVSALLVPWAIRGVNGLYVASLGGAGELGAAGTPAAALFQLACSFAVLLPPTAFMGATLPLLARHAVEREDQIAARVGLLYAVNTAGAIAGTLCAGFWLMPEFGLRRTVWLGAAVNAAVFALAALLARRAAYVAPSAPQPRALPRGSSWILPAMLLSGVVSFAYEVLWTRLLGHLLGASLQAFATMLASFLLGIALGSAVAARLAATRERAAAGFAWSQLGIALTSYAIFSGSGFLPELSARLGAGPQASLASAAVAIAGLLPITLCIGATFPFAVRVLAGAAERAAEATARVYAWNTVGAIAGSLGAGFVALPLLGFEGTLMLGVGINLLLAGGAALAFPRRWLPMALAAACLVGLALVPARLPFELLTASSMRGAPIEPEEVLYQGVGRTTTVLAIDRGMHVQITTDGLPESSFDRKGLLPFVNVAQWLGMLPALLRPEAERQLVIGFGGGVALEHIPRTIEAIDVIELEPEVVEANRRTASERARDPLSDPRVRVHLGDARGSLQLAGRRYGAIVSQPSHPWTAGASHLYTREFFELVRAHLEPDGVFVQWIGTRFVDESLLESLLASLLAAFPHVELFKPRQNGLLFAASARPLDTLENAARALSTAPEDFAAVGLHRLEDVAAAWALDERGVRALAEGAPINTDDHNLLAARSARLGDASLGRVGAERLMVPHDPVRGLALDIEAVVRRLCAQFQFERATELAISAEPAVEETALGWVELARGRAPRADRHFRQALSIEPGRREAVAGRIAANRLALSQGKPVAGITPSELEPAFAAVVEGWRAQRAADWQKVADLDPQLGAIGPGQPLHPEAVRLRVAQRLASGGSQEAAEAMPLIETLLLRHWDSQDALRHARIAILAGRPQAAWGSLSRLASTLRGGQRGRALAERILQEAEALPGILAIHVRRQVAQRSGAQRSGRGPRTPAPETDLPLE